MHGHYLFYIGLMTVWLLIGSHQTVAAYTQATMPSAWSTTPTMSSSVQTSYQFRSTSSYAPSGRVQVYAVGASSPSYSPRRNDPTGWGTPGEDDDPVGTLPDPTPVGEPYILLLFAGIYALYYIRRKYRKTLTADNSDK